MQRSGVFMEMELELATSASESTLCPSGRLQAYDLNCIIEYDTEQIQIISRVVSIIMKRVMRLEHFHY